MIWIVYSATMNKATLLCFLSLWFGQVTVPKIGATIIAVVPKSDAIWVGADGLRTDSQTFSNVCKVHQAFGGILLKFGNTSDPDSTYSTDTDIRNLIVQKKLFAEFQQPAADVLRDRVSAHLKELIQELKTDPLNRGVFDDEDTVARWGIPPKIVGDALVGLVFIDSEAGVLTIHELTVSLSVEPVIVDGKQRYRWVVNKPVWNIQDSKLPALYGFTPLNQDSTMKDYAHRISAEPEQMPVLLPIFGDYLNGLLGTCDFARPYTILKITPHTLDSTGMSSHLAKGRLLNTVNVEYKSPGNCPSWKAKPIPRPATCPR